MGVGMILVVPLENHRAVESELKRRREKYYRIGQIRRCDPPQTSSCLHGDPAGVDVLR